MFRRITCIAIICVLAVISSLQTLHSKLMQLEHERDAAVLSEKQLNSQSAKLAQRSLQPSHEDKAPLKALGTFIL